VDPRAAVVLVTCVALLMVALCVPVGSGIAATVALDWVLVAVPALLTALGRPVSRA
jgi:hypothetical protein